MKIKDTIWHVAIRNKPIGSIIEDQSTPFILVPNPRFKWAADPFIVENEGVLYIFAEVFSLMKWKGSIGFCTYKNGRFSKWKTIIDNKYHFSFPNIYYKDGVFYLMPETSAVKEIAVYRADQFPDSWIKDHIVIQGDRYVDSIWLKNKYIMTYRMGDINHLILLKPENNSWAVTDSYSDEKKRLRSAGALFCKEGITIRPVQDCSRLYGEAIDFRELVFYEEERLPEEKLVYRLEAKDIKVQTNKGLNLVGTHTYNGTMHYEVLDIQEEKLSLAWIFKRFILKFKHNKKAEENFNK